MAGQLLGIGLSQHFDLNGTFLAGGKLRIYDASTLDLAEVFTDFALTDPIAVDGDGAIVANAYGRLPMFYVADGFYRARLSSSVGTVIFDEDNIPAVGPAPEVDPGDATVASNGFQTGYVDWQPISGEREGWVRANARTIGSATSGADEEAGDHCEALFKHLWNTYADAICTVSGGRTTADTDWAAAKTIRLLDMRGRTQAGMDGMGNSLSTRLTSATVTTGSPDTAASSGGLQTHRLMAAELPEHYHNFSVNTSADGLHVHGTGEFRHLVRVNGTNTSVNTGTAALAPDSSQAVEMIEAGHHSHTVSGYTDNGVGAVFTPHNNMPPFMVGTYYIKL